jgi:valine--pyruvate aminotransferase
MSTNLSKFRTSKIGARMSQLTGVRAIMKDIIETLRLGKDRKFYNFSAGNPLIIPEVEQLWREFTAALLAKKDFANVVGRYGGTQGYEPLIEAVVSDFKSRFGLNITERNVLITPGSQSLYFYAANAYGGYLEDGSIRRIVLPLCPDYTGYGGVSVYSDVVKSFRPALEIEEEQHRFKYHPNFDDLEIAEDTGCVIFSRPSNPTGNVLTDDEVRQLAAMAEQVNAPVFIDSAYGPPFPALNFTEMTPIFGSNIIHCMSLSKAGLPGERIGIAVGPEEVLQTLECFESNSCIHASRFGQALVTEAINSGKLAELSTKVIRPFYKSKMQILEQALDHFMPKDLPWFLHKGEGAIFAWLWLKDLPCTDVELYHKLKEQDVIVVPGNTFFPGLAEPWSHTSQCLRISLTAPDADLTEGLKRLASVVKSVY